MIRRVKTGSFKDDADRQKNLPKSVFSALGALLQDRIIKMLLPVKLNATVLTSIGIDRHRSASLATPHYSPASKRFQEVANKNPISISLTEAPLRPASKGQVDGVESGRYDQADSWVNRAIAGGYAA